MEEQAHFTEKQLEVLRDFFTEEEIARMIEEKKPYPFEDLSALDSALGI